MKKLINSIKTKVNSAIISARTAIESTSGEGYIDTGVKIIIGQTGITACLAFLEAD